MSNPILDAINLADSKYSEVSTIKLLVFTVGKLTLALPVEQVIKVTKYNPIYGSGTSYVNLTHIGKLGLAVIDLHQKLFNVSLDELTSNGGYFILTKSRPVTVVKDGRKINHSFMEESVGIRVIESPSLIDVDFSCIRTLPNSYRWHDTLEIASHVAVVPQVDSTTKTIFVLDLECLV